MALIRISNLAKHFGSNKVLRNINLEVNKGDVISIIGPSGSGKSTFLRCINQLEIPTKGQIWFDDILIGDFDTYYLKRIYREKEKFRISKKEIKKDVSLSKEEKSLRIAAILKERDEKIAFNKAQIAAIKENIRSECLMNINEYRSKVNMVFQQFNLFNNLNVVENCILMQDAFVGEDVKLNCVVMDKNAVITPKKVLSGDKSYPLFVGKEIVI